MFTNLNRLISTTLVILIVLISGIGLALISNGKGQAKFDAAGDVHPDMGIGTAETPSPHPLQVQLKSQKEPRLHITTSGAVGVPAVISFPNGTSQSSHPASILSPSDWSVDFKEGFDIDLSNWEVYDLSVDGYDRTWGLDDYSVYSGNGAAWIAAGGADFVDPEFSYYPDDMDTWLISNGYVDLSNVQMADVEFYMYYDTEPEFDYVFVGASVDGVDFYGEYWTGFSGGWQSFDVDLSYFIGYPEVYLGWYFYSDELNDLDYEGVWIDDITLWLYEDTGPITGSDSIVNGDFESGDLTGWDVPVDSTVDVISATNPISGSYVAFFGGIPDTSEMFYQSMTIPDEEVTSASFSYWSNMFGEEIEFGADIFCAGIYDETLSSILVDVGCLDGIEAFTTMFDPAEWWWVEYTLSGEEWDSIRGQTVNVVFEMYTNDSLDTRVYIDDVGFEIITGGSAGDANEPNDFYDEAIILSTLPYSMTNLTIDPDEDHDFFSLDANAGDTIIIDIDADVHGSWLDSYVWLIDETGEVVCENDDDDYSFDSYIVCDLAEAGTYFVVVTSYDGSGDRSYEYALRIDRIGSGDPSPTPPPTPIPTPEPTPAEEGTWTAILYLDGDNNLCDSYPALITRMENELGPKIAGENAFLNVAVLFDRDPNHCSTGDTTRYLIQPNGSYADNVNRWDMGELNMGDPQTLINFATWTMQNYPAEKYYLSIDNHGGGISGIAWDDSHQEDNLTNDELYTAMKQISQNGSIKIDIFTFEACLMGMYENAYDLREFVDYVFAFPTISFTNNASYPSYLGYQNFTAASTGRDMGEIIFDTYYNAVGPGNYYNESLVDVSKIAAVHTAVDNWANALSAQLGTMKTAITTARSNAQKIDTNVDGRLSDEDMYLDLWDLADKMAAEGLASTEASALKSAIEAAVVRTNYRSAGGLDYQNTHGLSIYWPMTASGWYSSYVGDQIYNSTRVGAWDEFLVAYFGPKTRGAMPVDSGAIERELAVTTSYVYLPFVTR